MQLLSNQPEEWKAATAVLLMVSGACIGVFGVIMSSANPRGRANPGDMLLAVGAVVCLWGAWILGLPGAVLAGVTLGIAVRALISFGHAIDEFHNPTGTQPGRYEERLRALRQRERDRRVAVETVRRYEHELRMRGEPTVSDPIEIRPHPRHRQTFIASILIAAAESLCGQDPKKDGEPGDVVDAEYTELGVEIEALPAPAETPPEDGETLVRFQTPIDTADLFRHPDKPRRMMEAILTQLGDGARIVGIRARRE